MIWNNNDNYIIIIEQYIILPVTLCFLLRLSASTRSSKLDMLERDFKRNAGIQYPPYYTWQMYAQCISQKGISC